MSDDPADDGELRRRAAWLLGMLVIVAILIVIVMSALLSNDDPKHNSNPIGPDPITSTAPPTTEPSSSRHGESTSTSPTDSSSATSSSSASGSTLPTGSTSCPGSQTCALTGDVGNAAAAITAYLTGHGRSAVPVSVSADAQKCAISRGDTCSGGWAETELSSPDGTLAVQKISQYAKFTSTSYKSIDIGWAFNPTTKTYYFVTIRQS